jgi:hypothetical protein
MKIIHQHTPSQLLGPVSLLLIHYKAIHLYGDFKRNFVPVDLHLLFPSRVSTRK